MVPSPLSQDILVCDPHSLDQHPSTSMQIQIQPDMVMTVPECFHSQYCQCPFCVVTVCLRDPEVSLCATHAGSGSSIPECGHPANRDNYSIETRPRNSRNTQCSSPAPPPTPSHSVCSMVAGITLVDCFLQALRYFGGKRPVYPEVWVVFEVSTCGLISQSKERVFLFLFLFG